LPSLWRGVLLDADNVGPVLVEDDRDVNLRKHSEDRTFGQIWVAAVAQRAGIAV
jgi:hypothetical protein